MLSGIHEPMGTASTTVRARTGVWVIDRDQQVVTPAFLPVTECGLVPYLTCDLLMEMRNLYPGSFGLVYVDGQGGLSMLDSPDPQQRKLKEAGGALGGFGACLMFKDLLSGAQRTQCGASTISIDTYHGRKVLRPKDVQDLVTGIQPLLVAAPMDDICAKAGPTDAGSRDTAKAPSSCRGEKNLERSFKWLDQILAVRDLKGSPQLRVVASIVGGANREVRTKYLRHVLARGVDGLLLTGVGGGGESWSNQLQCVRDVVDDLEQEQQRQPRASSMARVVAASLSSPGQVLDLISSGVDLVATAYPLTLSRDGHALVFPLPQSPSTASNEGHEVKRRRVEQNGQIKTPGVEESREPSGVINLWDREWRADVRPLVAECGCPCCSRHSRAYIHHLLLAHELLAEVLLYVHNIAHYLRLFELARESILHDQLHVFVESVKGMLQDGRKEMSAACESVTA